MQAPAFYFPIENGKYEVKPGFFPLGTSFGNGRQDSSLFQLDSDFRYYRRQKLKSRSEKLEKYFCTDQIEGKTLSATAALIIDQLCADYKNYFKFDSTHRQYTTLECSLTSEKLIFDRQWQLIESEADVNPPYHHVLDALASQIQEDLALLQFDSAYGNRLVAIHLCFPNHWGAQSKIANNFTTIHKPVPGIDNINKKSSALLKAVVDKGPMVRFAWGLSTDRRLNHHPQPAEGQDESLWHGRKFNANDPCLFLRVERQVCWGMHQSQSMLFTINTRFIDCHEIKKNRDRLSLLISAISSMSKESLNYKGLDEDKSAIINWLGSPN